MAKWRSTAWVGWLIFHDFRKRWRLSGQPPFSMQGNPFACTVRQQTTFTFPICSGNVPGTELISSFPEWEILFSVGPRVGNKTLSEQTIVNSRGCARIGDGICSPRSNN